MVIVSSTIMEKPNGIVDTYIVYKKYILPSVEDKTHTHKTQIKSRKKNSKKYSFGSLGQMPAHFMFRE